MTTPLALAADFIERAANPAYGAETNELYGLRWAMLTQERDPAWLDLEKLGPEDGELLSAEAWLWLAASLDENQPELPMEFADSLFESADDPVLRLRLAGGFLHHPRLARRYETVGALEEQPRSWARERLLRLTETAESREEIEEMALILIQVANKPALALLQGLDRRRPQLVNELVQRIAEQSGDEPTRLRMSLGLRDTAAE